MVLPVVEGAPGVSNLIEDIRALQDKKASLDIIDS